jgi:short-subunit dehydrogenase
MVQVLNAGGGPALEGYDCDTNMTSFLRLEISIDYHRYKDVDQFRMLNLSKMPIALVVGASRGFGFELAKNLHSKNFQVFATTRSPEPHIRKDLHQTGADFSDEINIVPSIDLTQEDAGERIATYLKSDLGLGVAEEKQLDLVIMNAGVFKSDVRYLLRKEERY